ncbi:MAG: type II toxin-antitoxin system VapC family toxin [Candidatus Dormibacteria bacterium]
MLERFADDRPLVPELRPFEVANVLTTAELLGGLPIEVEEIGRETVLGSVAALAREFRLSVYDAAYPAPALRVKAPLATAAGRFREAAAGAGVAGVEMP